MDDEDKAAFERLRLAAQIEQEGVGGVGVYPWIRIHTLPHAVGS